MVGERVDLRRALGVTRVARVTGLDRTGIEVASAVRPEGHVLQVCNGKGLRFEEAEQGALHETAELWASERVPLPELIWGTADELPGGWTDVPLAAPRLWGSGVRCAWRRALELQSGAEVLVPALAVHCPPSSGPLLGPAAARWTSNGTAAHPVREAALQHALCEAIERDQLARAFPSGWTAGAVRRRKLRTVPARVAALVERLAGRGFDAHLFDASGSIGVPVAAALLVDREEGPVPLTAGYACRPRAEDALVAALLEAAQSRLTDVHGAREDVVPADRRQMAALRRACEAAPGRAPLPRDEERLLRALGKAGFARAAAVDLAPGTLPVHVVKVIVPGLRLSELL